LLRATGSGLAPATESCETAASTVAPTDIPPPHPPPRVALIACSVFESEIARHTADMPGIAVIRTLEMGLHDRPDRLRTSLQDEITALDARADLDVVVLAYGLCGMGTAGLRAGRHPLVIPRAHDCFTVFLGSKEKYAAHQLACPTCYYYTPGWNRNRRVPGPERLEATRADLAQRFSPDDVEFLLDTERDAWALHDTATFIDLDTPDAPAEADYARRCAAWLGWKFEHIKGDPTLLRDLLQGPWDDLRFQVVPPGSSLAHSADDAILRLGPPSNTTP